MSKELDAEVAEKVMGWWSVGCDTSNMLRSEIWADGTRKIYGFNPSEDIATAFQVIEKMREQLFSRRERFSTELNRIVSFRILKFTRIDPSQLILFVQPEDICRAALEAMK